MTYYRKGTYFERLTQHWLERNNYYVMRSAGSHGIFDLIAIAKYDVLDIEEWEEQHYNIGIQLKSVSNDNFNTEYVEKYLKGKEFKDFREIHFLNYPYPITLIFKYVFIYNRDNKKELPMVYWYAEPDAIVMLKYEWIKIQ